MRKLLAALWLLWAVSDTAMVLAMRLGWRPDPAAILDAAERTFTGWTPAMRAALHERDPVP